jgi:hypothetical protein
MIQRPPRTVYVNPQQLQRQREHRDQTRKSLVAAPDPVDVLAKAWRTDKLGPSPTTANYTEGR